MSVSSVLFSAASLVSLVMGLYKVFFGGDPQLDPVVVLVAINMAVLAIAAR